MNLAARIIHYFLNFYGIAPTPLFSGFNLYSAG